MSTHFLGIDVGTGSARAGVFDAAGTLLGTASRKIAVHHADGGVVEQSGDDIWSSVCASVRAAVEAADIPSSSVAGIGVDATCSMVVRGAEGEGLSVGGGERDVIVWMDHRAVDQATRINDGDHDVLRYVGGSISPEMQTPKLLWLKENRTETYRSAAHFFDLTDFLTWRMTGATDRSSCTVTCKWTYLAHEGRWDRDYFEAIGLDDLAEEDFARIGPRVVAPGTPLGEGLGEAAAAELGLDPGTQVAAGLIDAHAGGIGTVGAAGGPNDPTHVMAYVFGTSSCTMTTTEEPTFVPGVWGPYYDAMVPRMWLNEGGQSAAGAAIDHLVTLHPAHAEAVAEAEKAGRPLPVWLADRALERSGDAARAVAKAGGLHVVPEFLGNRAPFADPSARAVIAGVGMARDVDSLVDLYVAGLCGIGYGLRQILEVQSRNGAEVRLIAISGGAGAHPLIRQIVADATGLPVASPVSPEPVLLGSAILGAVAAGVQPDIRTAMAEMSRTDARCDPARGDTRAQHDRRYAAFRALQDAAREIRTSETT